MEDNMTSDMMEGSTRHSLANASLRDQYLRAGFGGRVGWGDKPAILVIDMAEAWTNPGEQLGSNLEAVAETISRLLAVAREVPLPVFFTTMAYDPLTEIGEVLRHKTPHCIGMVRGSPTVTLIGALARRPTEALIEKPHASAFFGTNLLSLLVDQRIDTVVVVGCSTSGCIRSTCESAFNYGLRAIVPQQAVGDRSPSAHDAALFDIDNRFADVIDVEDAVAHLDGVRRSKKTDGEP
jgi:nicotinamidase-related amidase